MSFISRDSAPPQSWEKPPPQSTNKKQKLSEEQIREVREAFELFDTDGSGEIDANELMVAMKALGFKPKREEIHALLKQAGAAPDEGIGFDKFLEMMTSKISEKDAQREVLKSFNIFTRSPGAGMFSLEELTTAVRKIMKDEQLSDEEIRLMFECADLTGSGVIQQADYLHFMRKTNLF